MNHREPLVARHQLLRRPISSPLLIPQFCNALTIFHKHSEGDQHTLSIPRPNCALRQRPKHQQINQPGNRDRAHNPPTLPIHPILQAGCRSQPDKNGQKTLQREINRKYRRLVNAEIRSSQCFECDYAVYECLSSINTPL